MKERLQELIANALPLVDAESDFLLGELDSLGVTTIMMLIADEYGVKLTSADVTPRNFCNVESLAALVAAKQAGE